MSGWGWCAARGGLSVVVCVHGLIAFACTHSQPYRKQTAQVTGPVGVYVIRRGRALDPFPLCDALAGFGSCLESPRCGAGASALAGWGLGPMHSLTHSPHARPRGCPHHVKPRSSSTASPSPMLRLSARHSPPVPTAKSPRCGAVQRPRAAYSFHLL